MKILCLQLARFGDIYQTWPTLNALKRYFPDAEIHLLVRERFASATHGLASVDKVWSLPNRSIFEPLLAPSPSPEDSLALLNQFVSQLRMENFDRIINLSFSPASSILTEMISNKSCLVTGYSRFSDGYLSLPDDASAYFYGQVGVERQNRIHISDLFALVAGVELAEEDFSAPKIQPKLKVSEKYIAIHVGASQPQKSCNSAQWKRLTELLLTTYNGKIVFIGGPSEGHLVPDITHERVLSLVGKGELHDFFSVIQEAQLLIGGDSVMIQIASLTQTPTLNISLSCVRFWETGPRAKGSRIIWFNEAKDTDMIQVSAEAIAMLNQKRTAYPMIQREAGFGVIYSLHGYIENDFEWDLIRAIYMNAEFPKLETADQFSAMQKLGELAQLGLEHVGQIRRGSKNELAVSILNQVDHLVGEVGRLVPSLYSAVRWYQGEKSRIGPGTVTEILDKTEDVFKRLAMIAKYYSDTALKVKFNSNEDLQWK